MHKQYRFIDTQVQDAAMNMAIDESVLAHHLQGEVPPTLRVFRWSQPSISLGRFQSVEREILSEVCQQQGVALVRRPTGGRAVYHRDEFTYRYQQALRSPARRSRSLCPSCPGTAYGTRKPWRAS